MNKAPQHGTHAYFKRGCRCADCKQAAIDFNLRNKPRKKFTRHHPQIVTWRCEVCGQRNDLRVKARCQHPTPWETAQAKDQVEMAALRRLAKASR